MTTTPLNFSERIRMFGSDADGVELHCDLCGDRWGGFVMLWHNGATLAEIVRSADVHRVTCSGVVR